MGTTSLAPEGFRSILNPNAPLFIPAAIREVEEFSPEWYELVKTSPWFREHWFSQQQDQGNLDDYEAEDIVNMLPDSFDLGIDDELSNFDGFVGDSSPKNRGLELDADSIMKNLGLKSPKNYAVKNLADAARYREKPIPAVSPKPSPRRIIQQPR